MTPDDWTTIGLWLAVVASGVYHGVNPAMGWPLALSAGLMGNGRGDLLTALVPLAGGHLLAMAGVLLPFAALSVLITWHREIRVVAGLVVIAAGIYLLVNRRHPRALARIRPAQLALWSFVVATAHGAGLMLLPIYLGLCGTLDAEPGHRAATLLMAGNLMIAIFVSIVHALAMIVTGGLVALAVHEWLGPGFISRSWFNLDFVWAFSLILVGGVSLTLTLSNMGQ